MYSVDCVERSGSLCLFWNESMDVTTISSNQNFIQTYIMYTDENLSFCSTFVYGDSDYQGRKILWQTLKNIKIPNGSIWCRGGTLMRFLEVQKSLEVGLQNRIKLMLLKSASKLAV